MDLNASILKPFYVVGPNSGDLNNASILKPLYLVGLIQEILIFDNFRHLGFHAVDAFGLGKNFLLKSLLIEK